MKRLVEPSTWAGLGVAAQVLKSFFPAYAICFDGAAAVAAALAGVLAEKGRAA